VAVETIEGASVALNDADRQTVAKLEEFLRASTRWHRRYNHARHGASSRGFHTFSSGRFTCSPRCSRRAMTWPLSLWSLCARS
jgi:hypothetical protein